MPDPHGDLLVGTALAFGLQPLFTLWCGTWQQPSQRGTETLYHRRKSFLKAEIHLRCPANNASLVVHELTFPLRVEGRLRDEYVRGEHMSDVLGFRVGEETDRAHRESHAPGDPSAGAEETGLPDRRPLQPTWQR